MGKRYEVRRRNGHEYKLCKGPLHSPEGEWLRLTSFGKRADNSGGLRGNCRACEYFWRYDRRPPDLLVGYVPIEHYRFAIIELERRLGREEAGRRIGIGRTTWRRWKHPTTVRIQRRKAFLLLTTLIEVRKNGEVRHKQSIKRGAYLRGEKELVPTDRKHFYVISGDAEAEAHKRYRKRLRDGR